jgi:hypothetical protein
MNMNTAKIAEALVMLRDPQGRQQLRERVERKVRRTARDKWRVLTQDRNHVFVFDGEPPVVPLPDNTEIIRYDRIEDIPQHAIDKMIEEGGPDALEWIRKEFAAHSVLWLAYIGGEYASRQLTRRGNFFERWFFPINEKDFVFMAAGTFPEFRGRGLNPLLKRYIMSQEMQPGGRVLVDCKVWNDSSFRAIMKNGFQPVAVMRNYWDGDTPIERTKSLLNKVFS